MFKLEETKWVIKNNLGGVAGNWGEIWQVQRGWELSMLIFIIKGIITYTT